MNIAREFEHLLKFDGLDDEIDHRARLVSVRFLSEVERICDKRKINRKELAKMVGTSQSYLTQLFRLDKMLNMKMIARIEIALDISFGITTGELKELRELAKTSRPN